MNIRTGSMVVINVFTPKPDALDDFLAVHIAALPGIRAAARGTRLLRAEDGSKAVMVSVFDTSEDFKVFSESAELAAHRAKILPLIERAEPSLYQLVYQAGDV
jgi:heme-degrading monooxygenase HmoA